MSRSSLTLVVNPAAGKGRAQEALPGVAGCLRDFDIDLQILLSRDFAEARELTRRAVADGAEAVAMMGGDGMMHLGINACARAQLAGHRVRLGLIPAGTGNDLCRGLGFAEDASGLQAAQVIGAGRTAPVDLADLGGVFVGTVIATGFDAMVNARANTMPRPKGSMRYPLATLAELRVFSPLHYRICLDGHERELDAMFIAVGNTCAYGGGMRICPDADPYDGLLDVTIIHPVGRLRLLRLLPRMYSGAFAHDPCVEQVRARRVRIDGAGLVAYGDGELLGATPVEAVARSAAVEVFLPG